MMDESCEPKHRVSLLLGWQASQLEGRARHGHVVIKAPCPLTSLQCHSLADLREQAANIIQGRQTMQQFMWQPDMLQVAKFLDAGVKRMQKINPDAGSGV